MAETKKAIRGNNITFKGHDLCVTASGQCLGINIEEFESFFERLCDKYLMEYVRGSIGAPFIGGDEREKFR